MINFACWNVRGLNDLPKQREIKDFVKDHSISCLGLLETRVRQVNKDVVLRGLMPGWKFENNYDFDTNGRIWFCWDPKVLDMVVVDRMDQAIHCKIRIPEKNFSCYISFVYGASKLNLRRSLWRDITYHAPLFCNEPWLVLGDFNALRFQYERNGGSTDWPGFMEELNDCLVAAELEDLHFGGCLYTWNNGCPGNFIRRKIDRAMVNNCWLSEMKGAAANFLPQGVSDHSPIVVKSGIDFRTGRKPFKFFNFWADYDEFLPLVGEAWNMEVVGHPMYQVCKKLRSVKAALKELNLRKCKDLGVKVKEAREELFSCQNLLEISGDPVLIEKEKECLAKLTVLTRNEESLAKQKSRVQWLNEGDQNTAYFFRTVNCRNNRNKMGSIQREDGSIVNDDKEIKKEVVSYFEKLLGRPSTIVYPGKEVLHNYVDKVISETDYDQLNRDVTDEEIKQAFFSLNPNKAPGPDGFNGFFFRKAWNVVGKDITNAIRSFFISGSMLREVNATIIALVPKIPNPTKLKDYRPISCCNTIYKGITKLIAERIKSVIPKVTDEAQSAFVQGRRISDNIFLAQELMRGYHKKNQLAKCAVKVDLMKAYDSIRWEFVWDTLDLMGFPRKVINWIQASMSTAMFSVSINGELNGYFPGAKGLRQGDPLSPYLFVLCMNVLSSILRKETGAASQFKHHWRCEKTKLTHLCFADDLMLFCKGEMLSATVLKNALDSFSNLSGLVPNCSKSNIFLTGVDEDLGRQLRQLFGFQKGNLPIRYLGVPLISSRLRPEDCNGLVERIVARVKSWTGKFLSYAGRVQLIKSVLFSMQSYWSAQFILPKKVLQKVEQYFRAFLWKGTDLKNTGAKVAWNDLTMPFDEGGQGIKKLEDWNKANMSRYLWLLCQPDSNSSWVKWVRANLLCKDQFWVAKVPWDSSWNWRKILNLRDCVRPLIKYKIGDGKFVSLWFDSWLPMGPIHSTFGDRVIYDAALGKNATVSSIIHDNHWKWPIANSTELLQLKRGIPSDMVPNCLRSDKAIWLPDSDNGFSIQSAWDQMRLKGTRVSWVHLLRFKGAIPRYGFILWLAIKERLTTQDKLVKIGKLQGMSCVLCRENIEDHDHLFFQCSYSNRIWRVLLAKCGWQCSEASWQGTIQWANQHMHGNSLKSSLGKLILSTTVYSIWNERNSRTFSNSYKDVVSVLKNIIFLIRSRVMGGSRFPLSEVNRHLKQEWKLP